MCLAITSLFAASDLQITTVMTPKMATTITTRATTKKASIVDQCYKHSFSVDGGLQITNATTKAVTTPLLPTSTIKQQPIKHIKQLT